MSDTEKDLAVHVAVCDQHYQQIAQSLKDGEKRKRLKRLLKHQRRSKS